MAYVVNKNGDRVILHVLAGADKSLIGLKVHHCSIISMTVDELFELVIQTRGVQEKNLFLETLFAHHVDFNTELVVLEAVENEDKSPFFEEQFISMLKLYTAADIYSCYFISYRYQEGKIISGGIAITIKYTHAVGGFLAKCCLTKQQFDCFAEWFDQYFPKLFKADRSEKYKAMLQAYERSFLIGIVELEYIMLFSILEMLFGTGNSEITYQISRGTALLLSNTSDEMQAINKQMKKLYNERSKYVHNGAKISVESLYELREIVRSVLIKLVDLNYHTNGKSFDELRTRIMLGGYNMFT